MMGATVPGVAIPADGPTPPPPLPDQIRYSSRVEAEQSVRRWARSMDAVMPPTEIGRLAKFLTDWAR